MNNDPIAGMDEAEIREACIDIILGKHEVLVSDMQLVGLIIERLQEWSCHISWYPQGWRTGGSCNEDPSLQRSFLKTALICGKWTPPQKQLTIEERLQNLEKEVRNISQLLKI